MKKIATFVFITFFLLLASYTTVFAEETSPQTVYVSPEETIESNPYLAAGERVEVYGTVEGDMYTSGGEVVIDGVINGDLFIAGGTVRISGKVTDNVKAAGGQLVIDGDIGGSLVVAGGNISIEDDASIGSYTIVMGGNTSILGDVAGNTYVFAGNTSTNSTIEGNLEAQVGMIRVGPKTVVVGDLVITSDEKPEIDESADIGGEVVVKEPEHKVPEEVKQVETKSISEVFASIKFITALLGAISTFLVGFILIRLFPRYMEVSRENIEKSTWRSLGWGVLALVVTPIVIVLLFVLIVTIPLAFLTMALYGIYTYLAKIFVIYWAGRKIFKNSSEVVSFAITLVIYVLITLIPVIGGLVSFAALLFGIGAGVLACNTIYMQMKEKKLA